MGYLMRRVGPLAPLGWSANIPTVSSLPLGPRRPFFYWFECGWQARCCSVRLQAHQYHCMCFDEPVAEVTASGWSMNSDFARTLRGLLETEPKGNDAPGYGWF